MKFVIFFAAILFAPLAQAETEYLPLKVGQTRVFDYYNLMSAPELGGKPYHQETKGLIRIKVLGTIQKGGKEYLHLQSTYENVFNLLPQDSYRRIAEEGIYIGSERDKKFTETLELPLPPTVGRTWDFDDGVKSKKTIAAEETLTTPAGTFERCIKVVREFLKPEEKKQFSSTDYYCPGVGDSKSTFEQNNHGMISRTIMQIKERP